MRNKPSKTDDRSDTACLDELIAEAAVERVNLNDAGEIVAVCSRGRERLRVRVIDLPLPELKPKGADWIDAYQR